MDDFRGELSTDGRCRGERVRYCYHGSKLFRLDIFPGRLWHFSCAVSSRLFRACVGHRSGAFDARYSDFHLFSYSAWLTDPGGYVVSGARISSSRRCESYTSQSVGEDLDSAFNILRSSSNKVFSAQLCSIQSTVTSRGWRLCLLLL